MEDLQGQDICRVCRCEGTSDRLLFHPCICTGSIKWIHQVHAINLIRVDVTITGYMDSIE